MEIIILTTTYNCEDYIDKCISTIMSQTHSNFRCFITDDLSTDNTIDRVRNLIHGDDRFILIENKTKMYQPGNYNQVIRGDYNINDDDVCVEIDGDDWLPDSKVLERIYTLYLDNNVWLANGSFKFNNGGMGFASPPSNFENVRNETFTLSHIRTWRSFLWRKIKEDDLKDSNGEFWSVAGDLSFMYPMVEMSGPDHYRFMGDINYIYNDSNPINDHKINLNKVLSINQIIRNYKPYEKL
jgi:glycosyltransferase involved in cell wall biosynthesis